MRCHQSSAQRSAGVRACPRRLSARSEVGGSPYIMMECIEGRSLKDHLANEPVEPHRTEEVMLRIAEAVDYAHREGLVHGDLKPGNILLDGQGHPHVTDFGLAMHKSDQRRLAGQVVGTPAYMAPEQVHGEADRVDDRTDLWSLGVILHEMLTGERPFDAKDHHRLLEEILRREPKPPRQINPAAPADLERICLKCLSKQVPERYQTAAALVQDLRRAAGIAAKRKPLLGVGGWTIGAAILLVCVGLAVATLSRPVSPKPIAIEPVVETPRNVDVSAAFFIGDQKNGFDTLASAIEAARDGDSIEIRGNGPFLIDTIDIGDKSLAIKAGPGFRPVIRLSNYRVVPLLTTAAALMLEGIEFQRIRKQGETKGKFGPVMVESRGADLYLANCRFALDSAKQTACIRADEVPFCELRNCVLYSGAASSIHWYPSSGDNLSLEPVSRAVSSGGRGTLRLAAARIWTGRDRLDRNLAIQRAPQCAGTPSAIDWGVWLEHFRADGDQPIGPLRRTAGGVVGGSRRQRSRSHSRLLCSGSQFDHRRRPTALGGIGAETAPTPYDHFRKPRPRCRKKGLPKELDRLQRLVDRGLNETAPLWPSVQTAFARVHKAAQTLDNPAKAAGSEVRKRLASLLGAMSRHRRNAGELEGAIAHFVKVSRSYWPGLFHCYDDSDLPRTNPRAKAAVRQLPLARTSHHRPEDGLPCNGPARSGSHPCLDRHSIEIFFSKRSFRLRSPCLDTTASPTGRSSRKTKTAHPISP